MIIRRGRPLANDHPEGLASCKWSSGGTSLLQIIIQRGWPPAKDHTEGPASCKWSSGGTGLLKIIFYQPRHSSHLCQDPDSISRTFLEQFVLVIVFISSWNVRKLWDKRWTTDMAKVAKKLPLKCFLLEFAIYTSILSFSCELAKNTLYIFALKSPLRKFSVV